MLSAWLYSSHVKTLYGCENILRYFRGARTYYNNLGVQAIKKVGNHCSSPIKCHVVLPVGCFAALVPHS